MTACCVGSIKLLGPEGRSGKVTGAAPELCPEQLQYILLGRMERCSSCSCPYKELKGCMDHPKTFPMAVRGLQDSLPAIRKVSSCVLLHHV